MKEGRNERKKVGTSDRRKELGKEEGTIDRKKELVTEGRN